MKTRIPDLLLGRLAVRVPSVPRISSSRAGRLVLWAALFLPLPTVIAEHYNRADLHRSTALERSFLSAGLGRILWEAWTTSPPVGTDLATRCPGTQWSTPPGPGWRLSDCDLFRGLRMR